MRKVADTARRFLSADGSPEDVVQRIGAFLDEVRADARPEPKTQDVRLGIGALWGEQLHEKLGWTWVHLTYGDGFASYAIVPEDRAFACFPLNRMQELMRGEAGANTSVPIWTAIASGALPRRQPRAYLVIG